MYQARVSCILITEADQVLGIWSEGDTRRLNFSNTSLLKRSVCEWMSAPVISIGSTARLSEAAEKMARYRLRRLLVLDEQGQPLGVLTQSDLVHQQGVEHYVQMRTLASVVSEPPLVLSDALSLSQMVERLARAERDAAVIACGDGSWSILTERDLIACLAEGLSAETSQPWRNSTLLCVPLETSLLDAVDLLKQKGYRHLGVLNAEQALVGLLSLTNILASAEYEYASQLSLALQEKAQADSRSAINQHLADQVILTAQDAIVITDAQGVIQKVNPSFTTLTGYSAEEVVGRKSDLLRPSKAAEQQLAEIRHALATEGYWQGELTSRRKNGEPFVEWLTISAVKNESGELFQYVGMFSDITEQKDQQEKIHSLANFDELTGLPNRRLFFDRLEVALGNAERYGHRVGVIFLDLDLFKRINDTLGHQAGDQVLMSVSQRLMTQVQQGDSLARLGGDEFALLVSEVNSMHQLEAQAAALIRVVTEPMEVLAHELVISCSLGISVYPAAGKTADLLIKHADTAMYRAKDNGRNNYCFYNSLMAERNYTDLALEHGLRRALDTRSLYLVYQPKIDVVSRRWVGMEALLRWRDEELGEVSPAEFIPVAERLGLIERLGWWVIDEVLAHLQRWSLQLPIPISVNVSARQLAVPDFASHLAKKVADAGLSSALLEIELTESCLIAEGAQVQHQALFDLHKAGFHLSMDDFGTGYSSLSYLRRLPVGTLKIDASFVRELTSNLEDSQLVQAMIAMAQALKLRVVAEGVETAAQATLLQALGCSVCQGYWLAKPQTESQVGAWLVASSASGLWSFFPPDWNPLSLS